jgi:DNA invertase Pin-like site-specific DNA recombinase
MTPTTPLRMIGYVRVSTAEQATSGLGLADQEKRIRDECGHRGWRMIRVERDEGASGKDLDRPGLRRALEAIAARRADGLIVAKLDRLSRSVIDFGELFLWFREEANATLVALDLGVDTSTAAGELVANVLMAVAAWERGVIAERTRAALAELRAQGRPVGRAALADHPDLQARIHAMRHDPPGMTLQQIADALNAAAIPTLRGGSTWRPSSVQTALGYKRPPKRRRRVDLPEPTRR